jgi:hypothetical protein
MCCFKKYRDVAAIAAGGSIGLTIPDAVYSVLCSWWWAEETPETCRAIYRNKWIEKTLHLVGCTLKIYFYGTLRLVLVTSWHQVTGLVFLRKDHHLFLKYLFRCNLWPHFSRRRLVFDPRSCGFYSEYIDKFLSEYVGCYRWIIL